MPNKNYLKGRRLEYKAKKELEADGWIMLRASGSHGFFDLAGIHPDLQGTIWLQLKGTNEPSAVDRLIKEFKDTLPVPESPYYIVGIWIWCEGKWTTYHL